MSCIYDSSPRDDKLIPTSISRNTSVTKPPSLSPSQPGYYALRLFLMCKMSKIVFSIDLYLFPLFF